jgi:2-polyprenyl-3-methyl-5-hydroxy-6-metoxy-1,4-benzoquinol methylase
MSSQYAAAVDAAAARANAAYFDHEYAERYADGAPHLAQRDLRHLYAELAGRAFDLARRDGAPPAVLDIGAGEGSTTRPFLEMGAHVTAVDLSADQLEVLQRRCAAFADRLEVRVSPADQVLDEALTDERSFDLVVATSFLHHIPDYLTLVDAAARVLRPGGVFFTFADPILYERTKPFTYYYVWGSYYLWRLFQPDLLGAAKREYRRRNYGLKDDDAYDSAEYHVTRGGVDERAIVELLTRIGFDCELRTYFGTQSGLLHRIGRALGLRNHFAILAQRRTGAPG